MVGFLFAQCSKRTTDATMVKDKATSVATAAKDPAKAWRSKAPAPGAARPIELGAYNSFTLDNGLEVIVVENHKLPVVSYQISLKHDALIEGEQAGYTSMAGSLLTKGTKTRTKAQLDEEIDFLGASLNAGATGLFATSLKKHSDKLLGLMTDVLYNPVFPEAEFEKEKTQTLSGLATQKTDPNSMAQNVAQILNFGKDHPYGEITTEETVKAMQLSKVKSYYDTYFRPNNAYLVIVGDITPAEARTSAERYFGTWNKGNLPNQNYADPAAPDGRKVSFVNKDGAVQSVIRITYPVELHPASPDVIPARIMNSILGGGIFSGRLMQNLREDKAYTYGARSSLSSDDLTGTFSATASVRNEVTDSSITEFIYEMQRMVDEPVTADDLSLAKASLAGGFARSLESPQTIANFALNTKKYNLAPDYYETYLQRLEAVTIADIQAMARKYIKPDNAYIVIAGNKDEVADKLLPFDSDGKIDYYDAYGNPVKYDEIALPAGVTPQTIISDYLTAIGGKDKLMAIKTLETNASMDLMGQSATVTIKQVKPDKMKMAISMNGMTMQETVLNGDKAMVGGMGQSQTMSAGDPGFDDVKEQAIFINQLYYMDGGYNIELKGIEDVNGESAYKIMVTAPSGKTTTEYYGVKNSLLLKQVNSTAGPTGEDMTITTEYSDYKEMDGVMMPYTMKTIGAAPFPMVMKVSEYKVNSPLADTEFMIK